MGGEGRLNCEASERYIVQNSSAVAFASRFSPLPGGQYSRKSYWGRGEGEGGDSPQGGGKGEGEWRQGKRGGVMIRAAGCPS